MPQFTQVTAGTFCRELAAGLEPLPDLLQSWGLTEDDYKKLRKNPWFQKELQAAVADVKDMGPDSTFIMRCKVLSEDFLPTLVGLMGHQLTPPDVKVKLFELITDLARLKPQKSSNDKGGGTGPQVVFNFGAGLNGIPTSMTLVPETKALEDANG